MSKNTRKVLSVLLTLMMLFAQFPQADHSHSHAHAEAAAELIRGTFEYAGMYNSRYDSTLDYAYTDAYFEGDAREYNPSLSTMSLCLEMSSWSSLDEQHWVDKSANARELLTEIGFVDFAQNDFWNDVPTLDSIGAVAAHKQLGDATLIALAVRGGGYYSEWGSNVLLGDSSDHDGFATARDNVLAFLTQYIEDCDITGRVKLWLVGFSRGGAVANMAAGYLNRHGLTADTTLVPADLYCYTVEAPQGVLDEDAGPDSEHRNIHNIINPNDIVPLVAPVNWGFSRYNQTSHLLPTITTTHYAEAREQMLKHYADILEGVDVLDPDRAAYNIPEYAKTLQMQVNWLNFLPGGEPFITIETVDNTHLPQAIMLAESVSALVEAAESRDSFHESIEADISVMLGEMLGASKGTSLSEYIAELGRTLTENNYQKLIYVLEPVVQLNLTPIDERIEAVGHRLREIIPQPEGYTDIVGTVGALADVFANMFVENPQALLNMALSLSSTSMIQAHYAEVTMAWLRTEDPNYSEQPFAHAVPESLRIVRVNCPVSLKVYDAEGTMVASIIDGECTATIEGIGCAVNPDGEMVLYLPADAAFRVEIIANDNGSVSCSINEFNIVRGKHTFVISYADLPINTNDSLTAVLPAIEAEEYTDEPRTGSTANYHLLGNNGAPIEPTLTLRGEDVLLHTVKAERNNEYGQVLGGGVYVHDSFAQLEAYPVSGGSFNGWYVDNQPVSTDPVYRFPVEGDITVVAHFGVATPSQITFRATEGGTVHNINNAYTPGSQVLLSATADEGYDFDEWTITAGDFMIVGDDLYYIVPATDATVTAKFARERIPCPNCEAMLPVDTSHTAPCGTEGHFTCAEDYVAEDHDVCEHCSALLCDGNNHAFCTICGDGYVCEGGHGYGSGECGVYICEGCGAEILNTETHAAPCRTAGHFTCADGYVAADHAACEHCSALLCDGNDHGICSICNDGYVCEGGHGYGSGECGVYTCEGCGVEILITESHAAPCGTAGHFTCAADYDAADHAACEHCSALLCDGNDHGLCTICNDGYVCEGGHGYGSGECGVYVCEGCGVEILITESHSAPCGTAGHFTCAADYDAADHAACEHCSALLCDGNDHGLCTICNDGYVCEGGHGYGSGECGVYACEGCGVEILITESHAAPCGTAGHFTCAADYDAADHAACEHCSALLCDGNDHGICSICNDGYVCEGGHGYGSGECGVYVCEGCGVEILITESHAAPCGTAGHFTCATEYDAADHAACEHCSALLCDGNDHGICSICNDGYVCEGGHGYGSGECGVYVCEGCGVEILITESHTAPCGTAGHFTCAADYVAADHAACEHCSALLCDGNDHGICSICNDGYVCEGGHGYGSGECGVYTCEGCGVEILITESHVAPCGTAGHFTCAADYVAADHAACEHCSALLCDGNDHGLCTICNDGYVCEGGHGYGSGECGVYTCEGCGVEILITESHAAPCGTAGHFTCATEYDAADHAACEHCSALLCDGNDHGICSICNDGYVCEGGHGYDSGECGVYACEGCGVEILITESHAAPCGTAGHFTCATEYDAADHAACEHCSALLCDGNDHGICSICNDGYVCEGGHGYGSGECGVYTCEGCGVEILITDSHAAPCGTAGHFTCAADYAAEEHALCYICATGNWCDGTHGYDEGQCGYIEPSPSYAPSESWVPTVCAYCGESMYYADDHTPECGTTGHYTCAEDYLAEDHELCSICGEGYVCDGLHGYDEGQCGYVETTDSWIPTVCAYCGESMYYADDHTPECGTAGHYTCAEDYLAEDHELCSICGEGYVCDGLHGYDEGQCGYVETTDSWVPTVCAYCGESMYYADDHTPECGTTGHYTCAEDYLAEDHELCSICGEGYVCDGLHGYDEGQCGYVESTDSWVPTVCAYCGESMYYADDHTPECGTAGHYTCAEDYLAEDHELCSICGEGYMCDGLHGYDEGQCGYVESTDSWVPTVCAYCGESMYYADDHTPECGTAGHYTCAEDYLAEDHELCSICGEGYVCDGLHGYDEGQCGYVESTDSTTPTPTESIAPNVCESCGAVLATDESHAAPCDIEGHYTCMAEYAKEDHEQCTYCSEYLCTLNPSCTSAPHIDFIAGNAAIGYLLRADLSSIPLV